MSMQKKTFRILLVTVLLLSTVLNTLLFYREGFGDLYYAATIKSMLTSFKDFFFASFDPAGFVSVDKPPLGLWVQALFVLVRETHDERAGLVAAFVLAITPMFVALSRNNTMDMQVVCILILASFTFFRAIQKKSFRHLLITFALVGLGFNVKLLLSFLVLPPVVIVWVLNRQIPLGRRLLQLAVAGCALLVISLSWLAIVELYPKSERPYVGSTRHNSAFELAFGYYGLQRIERQALPFVPGAPHPSADEAGKPGILRLFNRQLAGQISWFLPFVLVGTLFSLARLKDRSRTETRTLSLLYWLLWLLPFALYLSFGIGIVHRHYVVMLAPPLAALCGICGVQLWDSYAGKRSPDSRSRRPSWPRDFCSFSSSMSTAASRSISFRSPDTPAGSS